MKQHLYKPLSIALAVTGVASVIGGVLQKSKKRAVPLLTLGMVGVVSGIALAMVPELLETKKKYEQVLQMSDEEIEMINRSTSNVLGNCDEASPATADLLS